MISTSMRGSASFASTVARAGRLAGVAPARHPAVALTRGARRQIGGIGPRRPGGVHLVAVADIGDPYVGGKNLRLAGSRGGEDGVDPLQHLLGLAFGALGEIVGNLACHV